jgi:hypothetical protein
MALVDTGPLTVAVDRSLFGPQGRRWIERKLPEVVASVTFVMVSGFGATLLMYGICMDYQREGLLQSLTFLPKHICNALVLHMIARLLRWHVMHLIHGSFTPDQDSVFTRVVASAKGAFTNSGNSSGAGGSSSGSGADTGHSGPIQHPWPWSASLTAPGFTLAPTQGGSSEGDDTDDQQTRERGSTTGSMKLSSPRNRTGSAPTCSTAAALDSLPEGETADPDDDVSVTAADVAKTAAETASNIAAGAAVALLPPRSPQTDDSTSATAGSESALSSALRRRQQRAQESDSTTSSMFYTAATAHMLQDEYFFIKMVSQLSVLTFILLSVLLQVFSCSSATLSLQCKRSMPMQPVERTFCGASVLHHAENQTASDASTR